MIKVLEEFISINGEGLRAGERAYFIRLSGCNLCCSWCDTAWSQLGEGFNEYTIETVVERVLASGVRLVTLTGGEPMLHEESIDLINALTIRGIHVEVETNGSVLLQPIRERLDQEHMVRFTLDYKLPSSLMTEAMLLDNYLSVQPNDCVKLVVGSREDLLEAKRFIQHTKVNELAPVLLSPCFGQIEPVALVEMILEENWNNVRVQMQLHKWIWDPEQRGV